MEEEKDTFTNHYKCPHCYVNFSEKSDDINFLSSLEKPCEFCTLHLGYNNEHYQRKIAQRMIDVLPMTEINDFPKIIQFVLNQKQWKD